VYLFTSPARRKFLFAALYVSEGAPIGFLWWALPTILRSQGVPLEQITSLTSLLVLPWAFKFLWAPLVDRFQSPRWTLRSWILSTQFLMGVFLLPLLSIDLASDLSLLTIFLLAHAFAAATQDVSIDALCIHIAPEEERGALNGWMQAGMLTSRALLGGGALLMMPVLGTSGLIVLLLCFIWLPALLLLLTKDSPSSRQTQFGKDRPTERLLPLFITLLRQPATWLGLSFAAIAGAGFEAVGAVAGPYLMDHGTDQSTIGWFFSLPVIVALALGSLGGGYLADRLSRHRVVTISLVWMTVLIILLAVSDSLWQTEELWMQMMVLGLMYVGVGGFTSSSYALLMDITHPRLAASQFSAFMGATNLCESWSARAVGILIAGFGYPIAFVAMASVSLLSLPFLSALWRRSTDRT